MKTKHQCYLMWSYMLGMLGSTKYPNTVVASSVSRELYRII